MVRSWVGNVEKREVGVGERLEVVIVSGKNIEDIFVLGFGEMRISFFLRAF